LDNKFIDGVYALSSVFRVGNEYCMYELFPGDENVSDCYKERRELFNLSSRVVFLPNDDILN